jgi:hypothetical protein
LLSRGLLDNLLDKDGNNAWQMREIAQELDAIEQAGGGRTIGRMGILAGRKKQVLRTYPGNKSIEVQSF